MGICEIVTCEERIKSLKRARLVIGSSYTLGDDPFKNQIQRLNYDIESLIKNYEKEIEKLKSN